MKGRRDSAIAHKMRSDNHRCKDIICLSKFSEIWKKKRKHTVHGIDDDKHFGGGMKLWMIYYIREWVNTLKIWIMEKFIFGPGLQCSAFNSYEVGGLGGGGTTKSVGEWGGFPFSGENVCWTLNNKILSVGGLACSALFAVFSVEKMPNKKCWTQHLTISKVQHVRWTQHLRKSKKVLNIGDVHLNRFAVNLTYLTKVSHQFTCVSTLFDCLFCVC